MLSHVNETQVGTTETLKGSGLDWFTSSNSEHSKDLKIPWSPLPDAIGTLLQLLLEPFSNRIQCKPAIFVEEVIAVRNPEAILHGDFDIIRATP